LKSGLKNKKIKFEKPLSAEISALNPALKNFLFLDPVTSEP
jgi:hypothetical protein